MAEASKTKPSRWAEYYQNLYSTGNVITESALASFPALLVMEELNLPPIRDELSKLIDLLPHGKAPGKEGIPVEAIQCGKPALRSHLYELLCQCWEEGSVLQDMRGTNTVTLYMYKGDCSDSNNFRSIALLSITGKTFA